MTFFSAKKSCYVQVNRMVKNTHTILYVCHYASVYIWKCKQKKKNKTGPIHDMTEVAMVV
jgi:hypothetical protein